MKFFLLASLSLILHFPCQAQTHTASRYMNGIKNYALYSLISERCVRYMPKEKSSDCQRTVAGMMKLIDSGMIIPSVSQLDYEPQAFLFVAFRTSLIELLSEDSTTLYLNDVMDKLNRFLLGEIPDLNLWNLTLTHYPSPLQAAKVMAALFQDTSNAKLHLAYLMSARIPETTLYKTNKDLLSRTIDTINFVLDYRQEDYQQLFYPKEAQRPLNRNIYHFYVPYYLSGALRKNGSSLEMSFVAPVLMTLTYEFITAASDYRYIFSDPENLDPQDHAWKLKDIFAGYQGAGMGIGKKNLKNLNAIQAGFKESTARTVKAMLAQ